MSNKEINKFFQDLKILLIENETTITPDLVYEKLIKINIPEEQNSINISSIFEELDLKLKSINSINISYNQNTISFNSNTEINKPNPIKVYISMDYNYIYKNINKLVRYLKDIPFQMKVSSIMRNDNIIIRLSSIEDLNDLIKFINEELTEGIQKPNPFCYIIDKCAVTIDGNLSYLQILSNLISDYVNSKKDDIESIKSYDFYNYVIDIYSNTFVNLTTYSNINIPSCTNPIFDDKNYIYYKNILEFILKSSEDNFDMEMFIQHFNESNSLNSLNKEKKKYNTYNMLVIYKSINRDNISESLEKLNKYIESNDKSYITSKGFIRINMYLNNFRQNLKNILKENKMSLDELYNKLPIYNFSNNIDMSKTSKDLQYVISTLSEYHDYNSIIDILQIYFATNDISLITRENDLRNFVYNNNLRTNILALLIDKKISFSVYCENLESYILPDYIEEMKYEPIYEVKEEPIIEKPPIIPIQESNIQETQEIPEEEPIEKASKEVEEMKVEVKEEQPKDEFADLDEHFDITRIMIQAVNNANEIPNEPSEVTQEVEIEMVKEHNDETSALLDGEQNVDELLNKFNVIAGEIEKEQYDEKEEILSKSIYATYNKYQALYEEGKIKFDGFALVNYALTSILENNNYSSFTRINEARKNIQELSQQEILDIMANSLGLPHPELNSINHEALQSIIRDYIDKILNSDIKNKEK